MGTQLKSYMMLLFTCLAVILLLSTMVMSVSLAATTGSVEIVDANKGSEVPQIVKVRLL